MTILTPTSTSDTQRVMVLFLREDNIGSVKITREDTNKVLTPTIDSQTHNEGEASEITLSFDEDDLVEDNYYSVKISNSSDKTIYRGKLYITSVDNGNISLNTDSYIQYTTTDNNNEYIII